MCQRPVSCVEGVRRLIHTGGERKGHFLYGLCHVFLIGCCKGAVERVCWCTYSVLFSEHALCS